jgi:hypothetical protein
MANLEPKSLALESIEVRVRVESNDFCLISNSKGQSDTRLDTNIRSFLGLAFGQRKVYRDHQRKPSGLQWLNGHVVVIYENSKPQYSSWEVV